jgi:hypothetical protein
MNEQEVTKAEELRDAMREDGIATEPKAIHVQYIKGNENKPKKRFCPICHGDHMKSKCPSAKGNRTKW